MSKSIDPNIETHIYALDEYNADSNLYTVVDLIIQFYESRLDQTAEDLNNLTNLRLQKLLYFIQGLFMAKYSRPLFNEDFEAWKYGPVIRDLYYKYKDYSANTIHNNILYKSTNIKQLDEDKLKYVNKCLELTFSDSTRTLVNQSHRHYSWSLPYASTESNVMNKLTIKSCFEETYKVPECL